MGARTMRPQTAAMAARYASFTNSARPRISCAASISCPVPNRYTAAPLHTTHHAASSQSEARKAPSAAEVNIAPPRESNAALPTTETLLNPPASTRPPPLDVPVRDPQKSLPGYLFQVGKTYIGFYKTGLRNILTNRSLLASSSAAAPAKLEKTGRAATFPSRADTILQSRTRHDIARLPVFGLIILVCGEFTPLIVVAFPKLTPYTCRIPKQIEGLRKSAEARRAASFQALRTIANPGSNDALLKLAPGHIARTLGLTSRLWDRIGMDSPFSVSLSQRAIRNIASDDRLIKRDGGVTGLIDEEVILACEQRGLNVRGKTPGELRRRLADWVRKTTHGTRADTEGVSEASEEAVRNMLLSEEIIVGTTTHKAEANKA